MCISIWLREYLASEAVVKCIEELLDGYVSKTTIQYSKTLVEDIGIGAVNEKSNAVKGSWLFPINCTEVVNAMKNSSFCKLQVVWRWTIQKIGDLFRRS